MTASSHLLYASSNPIIFLFPDIEDEIMQLDNYSNWSCSYLCSNLYLLYNLLTVYHLLHEEPSRSWSYGSWIYNYLCNQCLLPPTLWVRTPHRRGIFVNTLCDRICQWLATGRWFSPVSSTNKTDRHAIVEILLKVALNTKTLTLFVWP